MHRLKVVPRFHVKWTFDGDGEVQCASHIRFILDNA